MREIGEQWVEEDGHMYKAVRQIGALIEKKDLGPVNEEGLLACPFCGANLNIISCHDGFYARCCNNDCALGVTDSFVEKQDLIDACNRRN